MSKGYTKQEVNDWQNWANKKTDQVAKMEKHMSTSYH